MLFNPNWDKPSLAGFEAWLNAQTQKVYDYADMHNCALGEYYKSIGRRPKRFADELFDSYEQQYMKLMELGAIE